MNGYDKHYIQTSNPYKKQTNKENPVRNVYYGEVVSIVDTAEGGRIAARIPDLDTKTNDAQLPLAMPMLPKHFWILPQVGEVVRIFLEDTRYPQRGRHWIGSVISQPHKIPYDGYFTALATTNVSVVNPDKNPSSIPDAIGVFPDNEDIALVGRKNTDVLLKDKEVLIRAGKHQIDNILALNKENPAFLQMNFFQLPNNNNTKTTLSTSVMMADKIALLSHDGIPKFKSNGLEKTDMDRIFNEGHPMMRGDLAVEALEVIRDAILQHIHGYSGLPADKSGIINQLQNIDFSKILQPNIRIN